MSYTAKDITVLEGLEPVRKRPGMYIGGVGSAGLHHLVWGIVDNAVDEAMNGHASEIVVTLHKDGKSVTVTDNGRGVPIDKHPTHKKTALELTAATGGNWQGYLDDIAKNNAPIGRFASAEELAKFFVFLCSPCSSYCVGSTFYVDGGWLNGLA